MTKFNTAIVTAVAALFVSGGVFGATLQPAAGNGPYFNQPVAMSSTLTRSAVEAEAAAHRPAAGEEDSGYARASMTAPAGSWHAIGAASKASRMPAAGEFSSWAQPVALHSALTRQAVEAEAAIHEPTAGEM